MIKKICSIFLLSLFLFPKAVVFADEEIGNLKPKTSHTAYRFTEHLAQAEAAILYEKKENLSGIWKDNYFAFPELPTDIQVKEVPVMLNGSRTEGIGLSLAEEGLMQLRFNQVPAGSKLVLYYGITQDPSLKKITYCYLQVWAGLHSFKRIRIGSDEGWKKESIDFGVMSFLNHDVTIIFQVHSDSPKRAKLTMIPEIQS